MAKINLTPDEFGDICVCFLLDKAIHPEEVIPLNEEFNKYTEKLIGRGIKPLSLKYYLGLNANMRVKYKRIKKVFEYDKSRSAIIYVWPSKKDKEKASKKDGIVKRAINKLLMKDDINREERQLLMEEYENDSQED